MYVIRNSGLELVAVLIEAKHTTNSALKHAIAQVMGYFAAFADTIQTPLVFVMTEQQIKLVLYPFTRTTGPQINAAICELPLFKENHCPDIRTVQMLVLLAKYPEYQETLLELPVDCTSLSRVVLKARISTEQQVVEQLQQQLTESKEQAQQLQQQLKEQAQQFQQQLKEQADQLTERISTEQQQKEKLQQQLKEQAQQLQQQLKEQAEQLKERISAEHQVVVEKLQQQLKEQAEQIAHLRASDHWWITVFPCNPLKTDLYYLNKKTTKNCTKNSSVDICSVVYEY